MNEMGFGKSSGRPARDISPIAGQYDRVALVLQGGGALGAYQIGVYQALSEAGCEPSWLSGVSIGAVNSAIIAGNPPERRLKHLEAFWNKISGRKIWAYKPEGDPWRVHASRARGSSCPARTARRASTIRASCAAPSRSSSISSF
jgi:predicted acylesterase/phospholipase RssA